MELTLKCVSINKQMSDETICFSATVYIDGKRAGTAHNRGCGGPTSVDWSDCDLGAEYEEWLADEVILAQDPTDPEKTMFITYEKIGWKVGEALEAYEDARWLKRQCKTKTLFKLNDQENPDDWWEIKAPFCELAKAKLQKMYGNNLGVIANETV